MTKGIILSSFLFFSSMTLIATDRVDLRSSNLLSKFLKNSQAGHASNLGLTKQESLQLIGQYRAKTGMTHSRYKQTYRGIPVWGEHIVVTENSLGKIVRLHGRLLTGLPSELLDTVPNFDAFWALQEAKLMHGDIDTGKRNLDDAEQAPFFENERSDLVIYVDDSGNSYLAYAVSYFTDSDQNGPSRPTFILDAKSGNILYFNEGLTTGEGTGPGGNQKVGQYRYDDNGGDFPGFQVTRSGGTCTMDNPNVRAVDLGNRGSNRSNTAYSYACFENTYKQINGAFSPINDALFFGNVVYDTFNAWAGAPPLSFQLKMKVHYRRNYENAFWNGSSMTFGDGANTFHPLVSLDVSAHEVAHGFTEQRSDLIYSGQSGGINEAFSDIAGEAAENFMRGSNDFLVGADIFKGNGALRYMSDPPLDGRSIGCADDFVSGMGVHFSSGVFNKAFYHLATTTGWNVEMAFKCFANANRDYWTPSTNFNNGAQGVFDAASDLGYNTNDVRNAFSAVCISIP